MSTVLQSKWVAVRKNHKCWGCGKDHLPGSEMCRVTTFDSGDFTTTYWCRPCNAFFKQMDNVDEGISFAEFRGEETYQEFLKTFQW